MATASFDPSQDRYIRGIIRRKARQLIGRAGFRRQDREDLEQEMFVRVLQSLPRFNPEVAHRNVFVTAVVERHVANILRNKRAVKRDDRRVTSMDVELEMDDEYCTRLAQNIGHEELDARLFRRRRSAEELSDLATDLAMVMRTLPEPWQRLIELRTMMSMSQIADTMKVPRTTLNAWLRRIRQRCEKMRLQQYLDF